MARKTYQNIIVVSCTVFIIILSQIPSNGFVEGGRIIRHKKSKIIVRDEGDIFDCVDIYKQPALNHPLLKNHTIEMQPSTLGGNLEARSSDAGLFQSWHKNGRCPKGTIPILRTKLPPKRLFTLPNLEDITVQHEHAIVDIFGDTDFFYGATASLNVWKPRIGGSDEFSLAQIWVLAGEGNELNSLEAGWQVYPKIYGDERPRFFIFWTRDGYHATGCYNLDCEGFVQTNLDIGIGGALDDVSTYNGEQFQITLSIHREASGNWWLKFNGAPVGYWPASIFTHLRNGATKINFGGEIVNSNPDGRHTSTAMGSGQFPNEGFAKAALISNLGYYDANLRIKDPTGLEAHAPNSNCYDVLPGQYRDTHYGIYFFFGGPGLSLQCT